MSDNVEFLDYIQDILDAMDRAEDFVRGKTQAQFEQDHLVNFAVVRALEIVGEAAKRVPQSVREQYLLIPWRKMAGLRDMLIHGYNNVDLEAVWRVVQDKIPQDRPHFQQILKDFTTKST